LSDLALVDVQQPDALDQPRYALHPLVRAFAGSRLNDLLSFEEGARERWYAWYRDLGSSLGWCWRNLDQLSILDPEQENAFVVLCYVYQKRQYDQAMKLAEGISYYFFVRGFWERKIRVDAMWADAAHQVGDFVTEIQARLHVVRVLLRQSKIAEADQLLAQLTTFEQSSEFPDIVRNDLQHVRAIRASQVGYLRTAQEIWQANLTDGTALEPQDRSNTMIWLASCLYEQGRTTEARVLFGEALELATKIGYERGVAFLYTELAMLDLDEGLLEDARQRMEISQAWARSHQDRQLVAEIEYASARLHILRGDFHTARSSLTLAIDLFERLGMRRELTKAHEELARVEQGTTDAG
jgi:tetratricopeptide (TPR) repeat protein